MDNQTRDAKLLEAARLIEEVRSSLNLSISKCESCGHNNQDNRSHFQMEVEMAATVRKCQKFAQRFKNNRGYWDETR